MNQYMSDSSFTDLDPRKLILDPNMQARDPELIANNKDREAQMRKQDSQDREILDDLLNGGTIRQPITVFEVGDKLYVVDGFHRTKAALQFLDKRPEETLKVNAKLIKNRTYEEAFIAAQYMNQGHGVGVSKTEVQQSMFRTLVVQRQFSFSVSELRKKFSCSQGQATHIQRALKACSEVLYDLSSDKQISVVHLIDILHDRLKEKYNLTASAWDSKRFPRIRKLSDAYTGKELPLVDDDEKLRQLIGNTRKDIEKLINVCGAGVFREALRKAVRGQELGIAVTKKSTWEAEHGYTEDSPFLEEYEDFVTTNEEKDGFYL